MVVYKFERCRTICLGFQGSSVRADPKTSPISELAVFVATGNISCNIRGIFHRATYLSRYLKIDVYYIKIRAIGCRVFTIDLQQ